MAGCRALKPEEIREANMSFGGEYENRDRLMFVIGISTGFRAKEILSLSQGQLVKDGRVVDEIYLESKNRKGEGDSYPVVVNERLEEYILDWYNELEQRGWRENSAPVFYSREKDADGNPRSISVRRALQVVQDVFNECGFDGKVGTHSMRKTFGIRFYKASGNDLRKTQLALGHSSIQSTIKYLDLDRDEINKTVASLNNDVI